MNTEKQQAEAETETTMITGRFIFTAFSLLAGCVFLEYGWNTGPVAMWPRLPRMTFGASIGILLMLYTLMKIIAGAFTSELKALIVDALEDMDAKARQVQTSLMAIPDLGDEEEEEEDDEEEDDDDEEEEEDDEQDDG